MPRLKEIEPVYVEYIPENPEPGKLYISEKFRTATHQAQNLIKEKEVVS